MVDHEFDFSDSHEVERTSRLISFHTEAVRPFEGIEPGTQFNIVGLPYEWAYLGIPLLSDAQKIAHHTFLSIDNEVPSDDPALSILVEPIKPLKHEDGLDIILPGLLSVGRPKLFRVHPEDGTGAYEKILKVKSSLSMKPFVWTRNT